MSQKLDAFFKDDKNININVDNDGVLCGGILSLLYNCTIDGFNNSDKTVIHNKDIPYDKLIYIDLHVGYPHIKSLDQHMVSINKKHNDMIASNLNKVNPNVDYGVYWYRYGDKFPFSTAIYLLARAEGEGKDLSVIDLNKPITDDFKLGDLIWQTDSSYENYFKYTRNVKNWFETLREMSNHGKFTEQLIEWIDTIPKDEEERKHFTNKIGCWYKTMFGCVNNHGSIKQGLINGNGNISDNVLKYIKTIGGLLGTEITDLENKQFTDIEFSCKSFTYNDVKERFDSTKLFSYGFIWSMGRERNIRASYVPKT